MKIVFRLNYHTVPGESLWLELAIISETGQREERVLPLAWLDHQHWEARVECEGSRVEYRYQYRQEHPHTVLDEWHGPRVIRIRKVDTYLALDTWCSAGTEDYAFETKAFAGMVPKRHALKRDATEGNHEFQLRMAAVPPGQAVCVLGSAPELGLWSLEKPVILSEVSENVWRASVDFRSDYPVEYKYGLYDLTTRKVVDIELWENRSIDAHYLSESQKTRISDEGYRRKPDALFRGAGVALPVFSLRSEKSLGVGEFADLKGFADWAKLAGLKLIQILPINDTTSSHRWTDSYPYSAISVFALHPQYLRIDALEYEMSEDFDRRVAEARHRLNPLAQVDYEAVMKAKVDLTREIYEEHRSSILASPQFENFLQLNREWVIPYAVFCVKRDEYGTADFSKWEKCSVFHWAWVNALVESDRWLEIAYHIWLQFELDAQLSEAVAYLHEQGIALKGDLPIGIDRESVDAWSAPHLFKMDAQTGAPPDAFAVKGQNWGFPTYHWEVMKQDGYAWWRNRFAQLSRYFDAYRIDHILGFFRIWQVPYDQVEGIMGYFDPALPIHRNEFGERQIPFEYERFCRPYLREHSLAGRFGQRVDEVKQRFIEPFRSDSWMLRDAFSNQRKIEEYFGAIDEAHPDWLLKEALMDCVSDVMFFEVPGSDGWEFHPRYGLQNTKSYQELHDDIKWRIDELYNDYFYRRQEEFWKAKGYEKLPAMRRASSMLLCGEDLGMVPACVPGVLKNLGILSLEIQRMPKTSNVAFFHPVDAPYMSVVSPSTHDMPTLRGWWREDAEVTAPFAWQLFGINLPPVELSGEIAQSIIDQHLKSPAMWAIFPLQDLLAMDEALRLADPDAERINVPAIIPFYWRYRSHLSVEELAKAENFNGLVKNLVKESGR
jgi:4-alpha-glucanotransferase